MTDPTSALIPAILSTLTPAQKAALRWLPADGSCNGEVHGRAAWDAMSGLRHLEIAPYVKAQLVGHDLEFGWRITDLGRRVREAIGDE